MIAIISPIDWPRLSREKHTFPTIETEANCGENLKLREPIDSAKVLFDAQTQLETWMIGTFHHPPRR
jgi:hypothetical protein